MRTFAPPRGRATTARLQLIRGRGVTIRATQEGELCRAVFSGRAPKASSDHGQVRIEYPRVALAGLVRRPARRAEIELNAAVPWTLLFVGGLGDSSIDLGALGLVGLEVTGGASNVRLLLPPPPGGDVRVRVESGASRLTLLRPPDVPTTLSIGGGASRLTFDGERYGAIGGATRLMSPGNDRGRDRYEIEVLGGAKDLTICEVGPCPPDVPPRRADPR